MDGLIVADKPAAWTSHDVVNRMRRLANTKKVGHLGTLDPDATGVLPLVIGRATRLAQYFQRTDKVYEAVIHFGWSTDSYDAAGEPTSPETEVLLDRDRMETELASFRGKITQIPPAISAKKIGGTPAYRLARQKITVEMKPVEVEIYLLEMLDCSGADLTIRMHSSTGTYVRSIAHDLGQKLGCGAFLRTLRRVSAGGFDLTMSRTLEELGALADAGNLAEALIPCAELLPEFPRELVDDTTAGFIRQGRDFRVSPFRSEPEAKFVKAVSYGGDLVAIGEAVLPHLYHPVLVL
ncbi:MAG: tRNA pseudouridine(55) synthase TruB [Bryobacteraceae bacterium]